MPLLNEPSSSSSGIVHSVSHASMNPSPSLSMQSAHSVFGLQRSSPPPPPPPRAPAPAPPAAEADVSPPLELEVSAVAVPPSAADDVGVNSTSAEHPPVKTRISGAARGAREDAVRLPPGAAIWRA